MDTKASEREVVDRVHILLTNFLEIAIYIYLYISIAHDFQERGYINFSSH